jgi:hypothetical protein
MFERYQSFDKLGKSTTQCPLLINVWNIPRGLLAVGKSTTQYPLVINVWRYKSGN